MYLNLVDEGERKFFDGKRVLQGIFYFFTSLLSIRTFQTSLRKYFTIVPITNLSKIYLGVSIWNDSPPCMRIRTDEVPYYDINFIRNTFSNNK